MEKTFSHLYPVSRSFDHDPDVITIGERKIDQPVNQSLCLSLRTLFTTPDRRSSHTNQSIDILLHSALTPEQKPRIPELLNLRQELPSSLKGIGQVSQLRTMASDLGELILIPATS